MLRITRLAEAGSTATTLKLEGKLTGPWVAELRRAADAFAAPKPLFLELAALTFVDAEGVRLLLSLERDGATLVGATGLVAALLQSEVGR